jgi:hypothetical protein
MKCKAIQLQTNTMIYDTGQKYYSLYFKLYDVLAFSRYIVFAMHLDIVKVMHLEKPKLLIIWNGGIICQIVMKG